MSPRAALLALLLVGCWLPSDAGAQDEPTPFWLPADPTPPPKKKAKERKQADEGEPGASVYVVPGEDEVAPPRKQGQKRGQKPLKAEKKPQQKTKPAKKAKKAAPPPEDDLPTAAPPSRKRKHEPLPAFPHLDPEDPARAPPAPPRPAREAGPAPAVREPEPPRPALELEPARRPLVSPSVSPSVSPLVSPSVSPLINPVARPKKEAFDPEQELGPAPVKPSEPAAPPPAPRPEPKQPKAEAPAAGDTPLRPERAPEVREPLPPEPPPEEYVPVPLRWRRSLTLLALGGMWQKPQGDGRAFEPGYGLQVGWAFAPWLLLDLTVLRSGSTQGSGFASTSLTHTLVAARLWAAWNKGVFSAIGGVGVGGALSQTVYSLQDVLQPETTLSATALQTVVSAGIGGRARPWRGLEVRLEVNTLLRDGRLEPILIAGAGWAF